MTITTREQSEITTANDSGRQPVVFVHGLWLLASSWDEWRARFEAEGYAVVAVDWPDDPTSVDAALDHPEAFAGKGVLEVADHIEEVVRALDRKPIVIGHSFGGLIAQNDRCRVARDETHQHEDGGQHHEQGGNRQQQPFEGKADHWIIPVAREQKRGCPN